MEQVERRKWNLEELSHIRAWPKHLLGHERRHPVCMSNEFGFCLFVDVSFVCYRDWGKFALNWNWFNLLKIYFIK